MRTCTRIVVVLAVLALVEVGSATALAKPEDEPKVRICHATNSNTNPYVRIEVAQSAVDGSTPGDHFSRHTGPVWDATLKDQHIKWGDVIPPVPGFHDGLNWDAATSPDFIANDCATPAVQAEEEEPEEEPVEPAEVEGVVIVKPAALAELPRTGSMTTYAAMAGVALLLAGFGLRGAGRRLEVKLGR